MPEFDPGPNDVWKDDDAFKNLANKPGMTLNKLSWHCASLACNECDQVIRYTFKKLEKTVFNLKTGENEETWIDFWWDTNHTSVQLKGGITQNIQNTPEGSKCECFCHRSQKYKDAIVGTKIVDTRTPSHQAVGRLVISPYDQKELSDEEREKLK